MKKGMEYQGVVEKIDFPNKGTVDCGEKGVALVKRTIPGQKVSFVVSKKRSGKCVGRLKEAYISVFNLRSVPFLCRVPETDRFVCLFPALSSGVSVKESGR